MPDMRDKEAARVQTLKGHSDSALSIVFLQDSTRFALALADHTVNFWDVGREMCIQTLKGYGEVSQPRIPFT